MVWTLFSATCPLLCILQVAVQGIRISDPSFAGQYFIAYQSGTDVVLSTTPSSNLTFRDIVFPNTQFPTQTCGSRFSRCNVTLIHDQSSSRLVALLAVGEGAAAALFDVVDSKLRLVEQQIIPPPNNSNCSLTAFVAGAGDNVWYGLCYKPTNNEAVTVNVFEFNIDFDSLNLSSLTEHIEDTTESFLLSIAIYSSCTASDSVYWFSDGFVYNLRADLSSSQVIRIHDIDVSACFGTGTRQVLYQNGFLLGYCLNVTVQVDICDVVGDTVVLNTTFFCLGNESVYLEINSENLRINTRANYTIPFPLDTSIPYVGDCVYSNGQVFFVGSSANGTVVLTNVLQNSTTVLASGAPVNHRVVGERFITFSGLNFSSVLDLSCPDPASPILETDRAFSLSTFLPNYQFSCLTVQPLATAESPTNSTHPEPTNSTTSSDVITNVTTAEPPPTVKPTSPNTTPPPLNTTTNTMTTAEHLDGAIIGIVFAVICIVLAICVGVFCWVRNVRKNRVTQYSLQETDRHDLSSYNPSNIEVTSASLHIKSSSPEVLETVFGPSPSHSNSDTQQLQSVDCGTCNLTEKMPKLLPAVPQSVGEERTSPQAGQGVQSVDGGNHRPVSQTTPPPHTLPYSIPPVSYPAFTRVSEQNELPSNEEVTDSTEQTVELSQPQQNDINTTAIISPPFTELPTIRQPSDYYPGRSHHWQALSNQSQQVSINQSHQASASQTPSDQSQQASINQSHQASASQTPSQQASINQTISTGQSEMNGSQSFLHLSSPPDTITSSAVQATPDCPSNGSGLETRQSFVSGVKNLVPDYGFHPDEHEGVIIRRNAERDEYIARKTEGVSVRNESTISHDFQREDSTTRSTGPDNERNSPVISDDSHSLTNSHEAPDSVNNTPPVEGSVGMSPTNAPTHLHH